MGANICAVLIVCALAKNARMPSSTTAQQARLAALYEVSSRLAETLDLSILLDTVMDATIELTNAERGFIMLLDERTGDLETMAARNFEKSTIETMAAEISHSVVERSVATGEAVLTSNAQEDNRFADYQSVIGYQLRSIMCAPLRGRGRIIGAAYVDNRFLSSVFSQEDLELLVTFANQAALAIDNAQLFTQTDQALARRVEELSVFQQIDHQLNRQLDLKRVLELALDWAIRLTNATSGAIGLIEDMRSSLPLLNILTEHGEDATKIDTHHPILMQVIGTGNSATSRHESAEPNAPITQLIVPIKKEGAATGLILLKSPFVNAFSQEDVQFVERLADRAAVAIENSSLYEEVQAAKQAQSDFIAVVTHELRAPMTAILGYTDLVVKGAAGSLNDEQTELLGIVASNVDRMKLLVHDLSDLNRIEMGQLNLSLATCDIRAIIREVVMSLTDSLNSKGQRVTQVVPDDIPTIYADRTRTVQVLTNLVTNAHKYTGTDGTIGIRARIEDSTVAIDVIDNGIGISEEDQEKLFTQFFRAERNLVREQVGWGLGLSIVKMLVEAQGGTIRFRSQLNKGSIFTFTIPIAQTG